MEMEEFNLGPMKLIHDEAGYGLAHQVPAKGKPGKFVWEVIANFTYVGDFMRFLSNHTLDFLQQEETNQLINFRMKQFTQPEEGKKDEST